MPVALFTYHAYGSWLPDRPQGYVERKLGVRPTNTKLAERQRRLMKHPPVLFDSATQRVLVERLLAIGEQEGFRVHAAAGEPTHLHTLVSWRDASRSFGSAGGRIKNLLSLFLSRRAGVTGRPWFSVGASRKRVEGRRHFEHLMTAYLPKHRGWFWSERDGWRGPRPGGRG